MESVKIYCLKNTRPATICGDNVFAKRGLVAYCVRAYSFYMSWYNNNHRYKQQIIIEYKQNFMKYSESICSGRT